MEKSIRGSTSKIPAASCRINIPLNLHNTPTCLAYLASHVALVFVFPINLQAAQTKHTSHPSILPCNPVHNSSNMLLFKIVEHFSRNPSRSKQFDRVYKSLKASKLSRDLESLPQNSFPGSHDVPRHLHNTDRLIPHRLVETVCFTNVAGRFESLCKQSSRAATRVTRKMRALRTIDPPPPLVEPRDRYSWKNRGRNRERETSSLHTPKPDACHDPQTKIIANNTATNGTDTAARYRVWGVHFFVGIHTYIFGDFGNRLVDY